MEIGLGESVRCMTSSVASVLILVLVEIGLGAPKRREHRVRVKKVLILVLVEIGLGEWQKQLLFLS